MNRRARYQEITTKSALNRVRGMSFEWSLNPYQGCAHGCHYCYARSFHQLRDQDPHRAFARRLRVKVNIEQVLRRELRRSSWHRQPVAIGTATDPYQPAEARYHLTRGCLTACHDHHTPVSLVTKGTLIWRDRNLLQAMSRRAGVTIVFSLTTLNVDTWLQLEPGTSPPQQRLNMLSRLAERGVKAGVLLAPILPGLTDDMDNLRQLVQAASDHGASFLGSQLVYLKPGAKEHFLRFLDDEHPELLAEYQRLFPGPYAPKQFSHRVERRVNELKRDYGLAGRPPTPQAQIQQLSFL